MKNNWWKEAVVYQVYPLSYKDTTGNGIGDLQGIIQKLDYIQSLGITIIWLNPIYESPCEDMGYDISDYKNILKQFGTMQDFEELLAQAHKRDLKIIMDLVVNHTSKEHAWFKKAVYENNTHYQDYYFFKDGKEGNPPNNWESIFGGPAWEFSEETQKYYLHLYAKGQPDLNWENKNLRTEVYDIMKFWFDKGIDGFRMDVINFISKDTRFLEKPTNIQSEKFYHNGPKLHEYLQEMHQEVLSKYECMTVGECPGVASDEAWQFVADNRKELDMVIHFELMFSDVGENGEFFKVGKIDLPKMKSIFSKWHHALYQRGWNCIYLMNHDQPRTVSRFGDDQKYWTESAKLLFMLQLSLCGTPFIYQGEEIGMTNCHFEPHEFRDIWMMNHYESELKKGVSKEDILPGLLYRGRDNSRTPFQWDDSKNAGFSNADETWIKMNPNYPEINVKAQDSEPKSILNFFRKMVQIRKNNRILVYGDYEDIAPDHQELFAYKRFENNETVYVLLNFSSENVDIKNLLPTNLENKVIISNYDRSNSNITSLAPYEGIILK